MLRIIFVLLVSFVLTSCASTKVVDLKSPCVASKDGICERRPVNLWLTNRSGSVFL